MKKFKNTIQPKCRTLIFMNTVVVERYYIKNRDQKFYNTLIKIKFYLQQLRKNNIQIDVF